MNKVKTNPEDKTPLDTTDSWHMHMDKIIQSRYHYHYGHCITIDISPLSKHNGKFPFNYDHDRFTLDIWTGFIALMSNIIFLHNGSNIGELGFNIPGTLHYQDDHTVSMKFSISGDFQKLKKAHI